MIDIMSRKHLEYYATGQHLRNATVARQHAIAANQAQRAQRIIAYNAAPTKCKMCNAALDYNNRHKSFCNRSCSASFNNSRRIVSDEHRAKTSATVRRAKPASERECKECGKMFSSTDRHRKAQTCSAQCSSVDRKRRTSDPKYRAGLRAQAVARVRAGTHQGWQSRSKVGPSYPERYFISLFETEKIAVDREVKIGRYFADFVVRGTKKVIEVDGAQHKYADHIERDKRKDQFLRDQGYEVFRVDWSNPRTQAGKDKLYPQIEMMKQYIGV